jgi:hypothetical protein
MVSKAALISSIRRLIRTYDGGTKIFDKKDFDNQNL